MAWTYAGTPGTADAAGLRDAVRLKIGDTETNEQQLTDAEIAFALGGATTGTTATILTASIEAVKYLIAKFARQVNNTRDGLSVSASDRTQHYRDLLDELEEEDEATALIAANDAVSVWAGGQSVAEKVADAALTDRVQPTFQVGMDDNPDSGSTTTPFVVP